MRIAVVCIDAFHSRNEYWNRYKGVGGLG